MKFTEIPYERLDVQALCSNVEKLTKEFRGASSAEEQMSLIKRVEEIGSHYRTVSAVCYVRYTINTKDEFYVKEQDYYDQSEPLIQEKFQEFTNAVLESKYREELEKKYGSLYFLNMELERKAFSPEIVPLMQEENALQVRYQKLYASAVVEFDGKKLPLPQLGLYKQDPDRAVREAAWKAEGQFFDEHREEFDEIFDQLIQNRTQQAKKLGFDTFVPLGYLRRKRNCYGVKEVAAFRREVVENLVPITMEIKKRQAKRIGIKDFKFYDNSFRFPDGNANPQGTPEELLAAGKKMYSEMSPETEAFIKLMFDMDLFDVLSKDGKAPGGYCTSFPDYHCPFIFSNFNGTSGDVDVLTHEAGHAFASYVADREIECADLRDPSMEGCETHSMSMEFLTAPWHHLFFKELTDKYELTHAEDALLFIPYGSMVDHFQEIVYSHPELTPEERNQKWAELEKEYRPYLDFADVPFYNRGAGWQRQLHIYLYPFYYIDYCLAQAMSLQFWVAAMKDREDAWKRYLEFVKLGGTKTFVDLAKAVGMKSPVDPGCLPEIAKQITAWLEEQYQKMGE